MPCPATRYMGTQENNRSWHNWLGNVNYVVPRYYQPSTLQDLVWIVQQAEAEGKKVKAVGRGWSYEDCAVSEDWVVDLSLLKTTITFLTDQATGPDIVTPAWRERHFGASAEKLYHVEAGIHLFELNQRLAEEEKLAMLTLGGSQGQTLAGAISTSTHGSNLDQPPLAGVVQAIHLVTTGGQEVWIESASEPLTADPNRIFITDPNGEIFTNSGFGTGWGLWTSVSEGSSKPGAPVTAVLTGPDRITLFIADPNGEIFTNSGFGTSWGQWTSVSEGSSKPGAPVTAVLTGPDRITLFITDPNGEIFTNSGFGTSWGQWTSVSEGSSKPGAPVTAVLTGPDRITLFITDPNGEIFTNSGFGTGWGLWTSVSEGSSPPGAPVTAVLTGPDRITLFIADPNGEIFTNSGFGTSWGQWTSVSEGSSKPGAAVTAVLTGPDRIALFIADPNGEIFTNSGFGTGWGLWTSVSEGSSPPGAPVTAVLTGPDRITLFIADPNGEIFTNSGFGTGWGLWTSVSEGSSTPGARVTAVLTEGLRSQLACADLQIIRDDALLRAASVTVGRFGVIYSYVIKVTKAYRFSEWTQELNWSSVSDALAVGIGRGSDVPVRAHLGNLAGLLADPPVGLEISTGVGDFHSLDILMSLNMKAHHGGKVCWVRRRWLTDNAHDLNLVDPSNPLCNHPAAKILLEATIQALSIYAGTIVAIPVVGLIKSNAIVADTLHLKTLALDPHSIGGQALAEALNAVFRAQMGNELAWLVAEINHIALRDGLGKSIGDGRRGPGWQLMAGLTEDAVADCYRSNAIELIFSTETTAYVDFVNRLLDDIEDFHTGGYISIRFSSRSNAYMSMHNVTTPLAVSVEVVSLYGLEGNDRWIAHVERTGKAMGGRPHWGQQNQMSIEDLFALYDAEDIRSWQEQCLRMVGPSSTTFSSNYTRRRGLEPV